LKPIDPQEISVAPDFRPSEAQPRWRKDFPIDWPIDHYVARRDFTKFLVLTSFAFVFGQAWIALQSLRRTREKPPRPVKIASLRDLPPGGATTFRFPAEHDPCVLVRARDGSLVAYSQKCTHLSCAVIPHVEKGVLHCPCHEGYFDLATGRNIAGPPPRPLPRVVVEVRGEDVYALSVETATV
jgi:nitrite reductase/ring-hydroxylating ferredoxin subunit